MKCRDESVSMWDIGKGFALTTFAAPSSKLNVVITLGFTVLSLQAFADILFFVSFIDVVD